MKFLKVQDTQRSIISKYFYIKRLTIIWKSEECKASMVVFLRLYKNLEGDEHNNKNTNKYSKLYKNAFTIVY